MKPTQWRVGKFSGRQVGRPWYAQRGLVLFTFRSWGEAYEYAVWRARWGTDA